jgi:hypothetical protein
VHFFEDANSKLMNSKNVKQKNWSGYRVRRKLKSHCMAIYRPAAVYGWFKSEKMVNGTKAFKHHAEIFPSDAGYADNKTGKRHTASFRNGN